MVSGLGAHLLDTLVRGTGVLGHHRARVLRGLVRGGVSMVHYIYVKLFIYSFFCICVDWVAVIRGLVRYNMVRHTEDVDSID
jgi:hypothetical protein